MPVKRRNGPKLIHAAALADWEAFFEFGHDFFGELKPHGLATRDEALAAAPEAWRALGARFMATWTPSTSRTLPWAYTEFGAPPGWTDPASNEDTR